MPPPPPPRARAGSAELITLSEYISDLGGTLPEGWMVKVSGTKAKDRTYIAPDGSKMRSRLEVARTLGLKLASGAREVAGGLVCVLVKYY